MTLLLTGCTTYNYNVTTTDTGGDSDLPKYYRDSNLNKLYISFKKAAKDNGWQISRMPVTMVFGKTKSKEHPHAIAWCSVNSGRLYIVVEPNFWNEATIYDREAVVYHELGHCFLDRDHCDYRYKDKHKASIMAANFETGDSTDYKERHDEYVKELFNPDPHCK